MEIDINKEWETLTDKISIQFNTVVNFEFVLFLIGIQYRGCGFKDFSRNEKLDLINLARCLMLSNAGFLKQVEEAAGEWPKFEQNGSMEVLPQGEQNKVIKSEIIKYFNNLQ